MKKIAYLSVCIAFLIFFTAPVVSAQILDGQWFELKIKIKGLLVEGDGITSASYSGKAYLNVQWDSVAPGYDYVVRSWDGDSWQSLTGQDVSVYGYNGVIMFEWPSSVYFNTNDSFHLNKVTNFKIKQETDGQLKSATIASQACSVYGSWLYGRRFYGGCTIKGKTIDPSKLPFTP